MFNTPFLPTAATVFAYSAFVLVRLAAFDFDASSFIVAGDSFVNADEAPHDIRVLQDSSGYDGQFFYRLSLDPFSREPSAFGIALDDPPRRQLRIGYPLLVWVLSAGNSALAPALLVLVNLISLGAIGFLSGELAQASGRHAAWGLALAGYPGFVLTLGRDTAEIVSTALLLLGILLSSRSRLGAAAVAMTAAVLCRETALLVPIAFGAAALFRLRSTRSEALRQMAAFSLPSIVLAGWASLLFIRWGEAPFGVTLLDSPMVGIIHFLGQNWLPETSHQIVWLIQFAVVATTALLVVVRLGASAGRHEPRLVVAWMLYLVLVASLSNQIWLEDYGFLRAYTECYVLGVLVLWSEHDEDVGSLAAWSAAGGLGWGLAVAEGCTWV